MIIEITTPEGVKVKVDCTENALHYFTDKINQIIKTSLDKSIEITGDGSGVRLSNELEQKIINTMRPIKEWTVRDIKCNFPFIETEKDIEMALQNMYKKGWVVVSGCGTDILYALTSLGHKMGG